VAVLDPVNACGSRVISLERLTYYHILVMGVKMRAGNHSQKPPPVGPVPGWRSGGQKSRKTRSGQTLKRSKRSGLLPVECGTSNPGDKKIGRRARGCATLYLSFRKAKPACRPSGTYPACYTRRAFRAREPFACQNRDEPQ